MKKILPVIVFAAVLFAPFAARAQSADAAKPAPSEVQKKEVSPADYKYEIGGAAGLTSGVGLSFRSWNERWGTQFTLCPIFSSESKRMFISAGLLQMYSIYGNSFSKLFIYGGGSLFLLRGSDHYTATGEKINSFGSTGQIHLNLGVGPGIEFFKGNFGFNIMSGFALYDSWYASSKKHIYDTNLTVECAAYYRFDI